MAMLAEPRRFRKKYNLVPRGKALFEDDNRFGTKMLERMGWKKGKGLGRHEDGSQEFVRVRYKNDSNGIGYEDRDDQWTEHEKQFNGLLTSLNNSEANSEIEDEDEQPERIGFGFQPTKKVKDKSKVKDKISGESLEEKSKKSKARVHYKKFTKGKDLSQYSEKDLANIFGKKTEESFQQFESIVIEPQNDVNSEENEDDDRKKFGITTINTGTSVNDYFKLKMEKLKKKRMQQGESSIFTTTDNGEDGTICEEEPKKKKDKKNNNVIIAQQEHLHENLEIMQNTEKRKNKKQKHTEVEEIPVENFEEISIKKSKKKKKAKLEVPEELPVENLEELEIEKSQKKSKKRKINIEIPINNTDELEIPVKKKKKIIKSNLQIAEITENILTDKKKEKHQSTTESSTDLKINDSSKSKIRKLTNCDPPEIPVSEQTTNSVYRISEFCAEKFRHTDLNRFPGSNLSEILGYGLEKNIKMEIVSSQNDIERITNLWSNAYDIFSTDKYKLYNECPLKKYAKQVRNAKKQKHKIPKINIKRFKNKSIFKTI